MVPVTMHLSKRSVLTIALLLCSVVHGSEQWAYVWQQVWTPAVKAAITDTAPLVNGFMPLVAEGQTRGTTMEVRRPNIDWPLLAELDAPTVAVIRVDVGFTNQIREDPDAAWSWIADQYDRAMNAARLAGAPHLGLQLDYDCPTEQLPRYADFLRNRPALLGELSITTLPDWLGRPGFSALLKEVDNFVLQVHGLDQPRSSADPVVLCEPERVQGWVAQAAATGIPFHIALPTYGYRLFFDRDGAFAGLGAEGTAQALAGTTARDLHADPVSISTLANELRQNPVSGYQGLAWFRMPVAGDALNWNATVWKKVLRGDPLNHQIETMIDWPQPGLLELHVRNAGITQPSGVCRIRLALEPDEIAAHDTHNGFRLENVVGETTLFLQGPYPAPDKTRLVAWFRMKAGTTEEVEATVELETQP